MGGSFNPAHEGHLHISLIALQRLGLDRVWWLVTPGNPLKDASELREIGERIAGARGIARHPRIAVTDFERHMPTPYALHTVQFLLRRFPGVRFVWIAGGDILAGFHRWLGWEEIFGALPVAVIDRPGHRHRALASRAASRFARRRLPESRTAGLPGAALPAWSYLTAPLLDVSSTAIREGRAACSRA